MYSIVDIETTGGQFGEEKIIEIAIYKFDGKEIVDSFSTLINPERSIDSYVQKLTGITEKMVKRAPKFHEVAKRIVEITQKTVLVAHNTAFDYRMLRQEFQSLGFPYKLKTLDTINLSKHLLPNQTSYGLKKLTKSLGIPHTSIHRAYGDAQATLELFKILLEKDIHKSIIKKSISNKIYREYAPKLVAMLDELPKDTGVYYLHNNNGKIIFIGVAENISNQVNAIFTHSDFALSNKIQNSTDKISTEITGSLLLAQMRYQQEVKTLKPKLNKLKKRKSFSKQAIEFPVKDFNIIDKGREAHEHSVIVVRNHAIKGYGYFNLHAQIDSEQKLMNRITAIQQSTQLKQQVAEFIQKRPESIQPIEKIHEE